MISDSTIATALPIMTYAVIGAFFSVRDIRTRRVPAKPVALASCVLVITLTLSVVVNGDAHRLLHAFIGAAVLFGFYLVLGMARAGSLGGGDARFAVPTGAVLGFEGTLQLAAGTAFAFLLVIPASFIIHAAAGTRQQQRHNHQIPFVPFISAGAIIAVIAATPLATALGLN